MELQGLFLDFEAAVEPVEADIKTAGSSEQPDPA
jgi:hypothetical protein